MKNVLAAISILSVMHITCMYSCCADNLEPSSSINNQSLLSGAVSKEAESTQLTQVDLARLQSKDLVLLVDKSGSMNMYCPSKASGGGMSKFLKHAAGFSLNLAVPQTFMSASPSSEWGWVVSQIKALSRLTQSIYRQGITVVFFDWGKPIVYEQVNAERMNRIFAAEHPGGGTDILPALYNQITAYFQRRAMTSGGVRPVLIVLITDGIICGDKHLRKIIVEATKNMTYANEITICIMQIGIWSMGEKAMMKLDTKLMAEGAKYHIVHTFPFKDLQNIGLTKAIANAIAHDLN